jgi:hypothetical protein
MQQAPINYLVIFLKFTLAQKVPCYYCLVGSSKAKRVNLIGLGRVFNFKIGCFVISAISWHKRERPNLELKTRPRFCPVSLSLSLLRVISEAGLVSN